MSAAFTTDKANQEFELKFAGPAGLLLNVSDPIVNKNALYCTISSGRIWRVLVARSSSCRVRRSTQWSRVVR